MNRHSRIFTALLILLSGLALLPQAPLLAGTVTWQRFAGGYEDVVSVTVARYFDSAVEGGNLEVRATTTAGSSATLSVYRTADNLFIGNLTWTGTDHYGVFAQTTNPLSITVRSSAGGETTIPVESAPSAVDISTLNAGSTDGIILGVLGLIAITGIVVATVAIRRR